MAGTEQGGDKTEAPTQKKLADARKKGDVAKSKDLTATVTLIAWLVALTMGGTVAVTRLSGLFEDGFSLIARGAPFHEAAGAFGWSAFMLFLLLSATVLLPAAITGTVVEFLQTGGLFSAEKLKPQIDKLNPAEGFKRMFSMDNLVELAKTMAKAVLVLFVVWLVLRATLPDIVERAGPGAMPLDSVSGTARAGAVLGFAGGLVRTILLWTLGAFLMVAVLDMAWQRHSYLKKLRMSLRDIRDEHKENEGDPHIKANRRQLHEEWASQNAVGAARGANVLVVNPTHLAIALAYDEATQPVPIMTAKGEGPLAAAMRAAAEEEGIPIIRHVPVARKLWEDGVVDDIIPRDMFDAIAQIILWAQKLREGTGPRHMDLDTGPAAIAAKETD
jgi:type III secretion protein U